MRHRARVAALAAADTAGRALLRLPGFLAILTGVAGVYLLAGLGWALVALSGFLLLIDRRI